MTATRPAGEAAPARAERVRQGAKGERTRLRIKSAFAELLGRKGFTSVTIADICRTADITVGGFYFHFASQEELLDEVMEEYLAALVGDLDSALAAHAGEGLATAVCGAFLKAYAEQVGLARTFQQLTRMRADYAARWRGASEGGMLKLAAALHTARTDLTAERARFLAYALVTMILSKLDLVYVYRDSAETAGGDARAGLARELVVLWERMVDLRQPA